MDRIFLIDGHAQIFRMYYAFMSHPLINSKGVDTSILFGFTKMVLELINKEHPTHLAVAFDAKGKTFRHESFDAYKANRPPAPELVVAALEPLKEILHALRIPTLSLCGVEADDTIGSMAKQWASGDSKVYMVTPDKDYGQLVAENIFQYKLPKGGNGDVEILGEKEICGYYGIGSPLNVIDILAIWGDASDNVPGVKGIGEVGAKKIVGKYGTVENILEHISELPARQQEKINSCRDTLQMSKFLVTIKTDVELPVRKEDTVLQKPYEPDVDAVFGKYEFRSLKKMISEFRTDSSPYAAAASTECPDTGGGEDYRTERRDAGRAYDFADDFPAEVEEAPVVTESDAEEVMSLARKNGCAAVGVVGPDTPQPRIIVGALQEDSTLSQPKAKFFICPEAGLAALRPLMEEAGVRKIGFDLKKLIKAVQKHSGCEVNGEIYDIQLLHYLIDPEISHSNSFIIKEYLGFDIDSCGKEEPSEPADLFSRNDEENEFKARLSLAETAGVLNIYLAGILTEKMGEKLSGLYRKVEMPLVRVLAGMELAGIRIDTAQLAEQSRLLTVQMNEIEKKAKELAGESAINLSSPKQVGELLFEKLKVDPKVRKSARGNYPTDEATLKSLENTHPIIREILEYRNLKKLLSTYINALPQLMDRATGKVHTTFNQALTATGRLSSNNPNLQNIPIRTERGREIRKAFVPSAPGGCIVSADYSQIELRLMAHMSGDANLIEAFESGKDVHAATAARLFGVDVDKVTDDERRKAKTVNFGIIYGISAFGLAERMEIGLKEAKEFIDAYFRTYPGVKEYISATIDRAHRDGYVETLYGRRRYLKDINSRNSNVRKFNERNAVNAPLQGSAADIIKIAMVSVAERLGKENLKSRMVLQVHDELVFDVVPGEKETVLAIAREEMEKAAVLKVKLIAECGYGENWLEAH